jgi:predicted kinase
VNASVRPASKRESRHGLPVPATQRALVVAGGLPGAGKSALLRGLTGVPALRVLDPEQVAEPVTRRLAGVPYGVLRPLVHAVHWLRILLALVGHDGTVVVHETATRATARAALTALARATARAAHLVWLDVDPATARHGQQTRRRVLSRARFARHVRRVGGMDLPGLRGWDSITVVHRPSTRDVIAKDPAPIRGADPS